MEWDKWVMTLGGRYDYATTSTLTRATNSLAENHDQQFSWRGGINYLFDNGISPYFSYSESFEPVSGSNSRGQPFDPSRGKQYEAVKIRAERYAGGGHRGGLSADQRQEPDG